MYYYTNPSDLINDKEEDEIIVNMQASLLDRMDAVKRNNCIRNA